MLVWYWRFDWWDNSRSKQKIHTLCQIGLSCYAKMPLACAYFMSMAKFSWMIGKKYQQQMYWFDAYFSYSTTFYKITQKCSKWIRWLRAKWLTIWKDDYLCCHAIMKMETICLNFYVFMRSMIKYSKYEFSSFVDKYEKSQRFLTIQFCARIRHIPTLTRTMTGLRWTRLERPSS